ncbi:MAG: hypothetical protein APF81_18950 [Desulfosporosinus sp. BRH_c37]|nr:MAG: hypothetical protein APF81_18950 [Desulfosporosinus sp. BRH_c37]
MNSYIRSIVIFNKDGDKRVVPLKQGVNIITGESKTGKSALVEIIDYCLCSSRCTVPKGKITGFAYLYVLPMCIDKQTIVIARYSWNYGGKMFIIREKLDFDINSLSLSYFDDKTELQHKDAQYEIESTLGLLVTNMGSDDEKQKKKASLRNMVSYMFQHQNLMASKFALFYRFADYYKRKDVIEQFPVFAGFISQEYYSDLILLNSLKEQLKKKQKQQKVNEKGSNYIKENLGPILGNYYALLGLDFDEKNTKVQKMVQLTKKLPEFDDTQLFGEAGITDRYHQLNNELEHLRDQERDVLLKLKNIGDATHNGNDFAEMLTDLKQQTTTAGEASEHYTCPLCGQQCDDLKETDAELFKASEWLEQEIILTKKYTQDFSEDIRILQEEHGRIETNIKEVWKQIKTIEKKFITSKELVSKREKINYAKARINLFLEMSQTGLFESVDQDISDLKEQIARLAEKVNGFDVETKKAKAQTFLSDNMNKLALTLDFEEEYRPISLNFSLVDNSFDLYHSQGSYEKIYLSEMGSGANWVSCHIAMFLSFLHYFASQEKSHMPSILFFDQPSQVYFPQVDNNKEKFSQADIAAVNKMYKTIFDEIAKISKDTGITPQIIIVDHVDGSDLEVKDEFMSYIRADWRDGRALI